MTVSVATLLIPDVDIPLELRAALNEGRREHAGRRLMELYDLDCDEVTALVGLRPCPPDDVG